MAEAQQHGRERLTDLVMQFQGDPATLPLLGGQDHARPLPLRMLQSREHRVDRLDQGGDIGGSRLGFETLIWMGQINLGGESA